MNILLCLLFLAVSSIGQLNGQMTMGMPPPPPTQTTTPPVSDTYTDTDNIMISRLGFLSKRFTNLNSMRHSTLLGGACFPCYIPVAYHLGYSSNQNLKRYCRESCDKNK
jgi:hypothetical protein